MKEPRVINVSCAPAPFMTITKFMEITGVPKSSIEKLIKNGVLPTIPKEKARGKVLIDMVETYRRIEAGQLVLLPIE